VVLASINDWAEIYLGMPETTMGTWASIGPSSEQYPMMISSAPNATTVAALLALLGTMTLNSLQYARHNSMIFSATVPSPPGLLIIKSNSSTSPRDIRASPKAGTSAESMPAASVEKNARQPTFFPD